MATSKCGLHLLNSTDADPPSDEPWDLNQLVSDLRQSREVTHNIRRPGPIRRMPSREILENTVAGLSAAMFPSHYGQIELGADNIDYFVGNTLDAALNMLLEQVRRTLIVSHDAAASSDTVNREAMRIATGLARQLPLIRNLLVSDLRSAFDGDPAATNFPEIMLGYPGIAAITSYRIAHALHRLGVPLLARLISGNAHSRTGVDIHPAATIGSRFFIDHGTGVVIGETAIIGNGVRLYQAVTLSALHFPTDASGAVVKGDARHPIVEDNVVIYAGATILGRITIGSGSTIGGNVWLTSSIPPNSHITQASTRRTAAAEDQEPQCPR